MKGKHSEVRLDGPRQGEEETTWGRRGESVCSDATEGIVIHSLTHPASERTLSTFVCESLC